MNFVISECFYSFTTFYKIPLKPEHLLFMQIYNIALVFSNNEKFNQRAIKIKA